MELLGLIKSTGAKCWKLDKLALSLHLSQHLSVSMRDPIISPKEKPDGGTTKQYDPSAPRTLTEFKEFRSNNPKVVTLNNGTTLRMMSELEWIDTAKRHNQKDALERHKVL